MLLRAAGGAVDIAVGCGYLLDPAGHAGTPRPTVMHYPHRISKVKRARKLGFRARMRTRNGRKIINAKRRRGQRVQAV